jgi:hypothetical protein
MVKREFRYFFAYHFTLRLQPDFARPVNGYLVNPSALQELLERPEKGLECCNTH